MKYFAFKKMSNSNTNFTFGKRTVSEIPRNMFNLEHYVCHTLQAFMNSLTLMPYKVFDVA